MKRNVQYRILSYIYFVEKKNVASIVVSYGSEFIRSAQALHYLCTSIGNM